MSAAAHYDPEPPIPFFEGKEVHSTKFKMTSSGAVPVGDRYFLMDEEIEIVVKARISQVHHNVDERTGQLVREHTAKVTKVTIAGEAFDG